MLEELSVRNYALIENLSLSFRGGLNILTGETGAGKSIIVGAISFLLGAKADADIIRAGAEEAGVSAVLRLGPEKREARAWLESRDIPFGNGGGEDEVIVRRTIKTGGRGTMYIQNVPVTRGDLEEFTAFLFDLHGQHAHEALSRKDNHRRYLDRFAGIEGEVEDFSRLFALLSEKRKAMESQIVSGRERETRLELLNFAVEEIDAARVRNGESRELEAEAARLSDYEKLEDAVNAAAESLYEGEHSVLHLARRARGSLENAASVDGSLSGLLGRAENLYYEAEDIASEFRAYRENLHSDPERLEEVEERLNLLYKLGRKYVPSGKKDVSGEGALLAYREEALAEIENLQAWEENRGRLKEEIAALEKEITLRAQGLAGKRKIAAERLSRGVTEIVSSLGMPNARFVVSVEPKGKDQLVIGQYGADETEFRISANRGEPLKDLAKIASGGELSRVMLAIKSALSGVSGMEMEGNGKNDGESGAGTLIFDEIDTGIGGEVALAVGKYLAKMALKKQIFCVTHLASIAVRADCHFRVEKRISRENAGERTVTTVSELDEKTRREEIARMLAGDSGGTAALAHADELLSKYGKG